MYFGGKKKQDEIEISLNLRIGEGNSVTHQVRNIEKSDEIVFQLKVKGPMPELKEVPKDPTLGNKVIDAEAMKRQSTYFGGKKRLDEIEESLNKRVSEGNSVTHQIKSNEKSDQAVFKLKVKGPLPQLKEAP